MNESNYFNLEKDPTTNDRFMVVLKIVVYKEKFGVYPDFLKDFENEKNKREGYPTKFWFIVPKENNEPAYLLDKEIGENLTNKYNEMYSSVIEDCENNGNWDSFPFDYENMILIFSK